MTLCSSCMTVRFKKREREESLQDVDAASV